MVEEVEVVFAGAGVTVFIFVRVLRCLLTDSLVLVFVLVLAVVRDEEGSEPIVAMVEALLSEEYEDVSLVVDPMVAIVEVLVSADGLWTLLEVEVEVRMEDSSMLAMA